MVYAQLTNNELWVYLSKDEQAAEQVFNYDGVILRDFSNVSQLETMISVMQDSPIVTTATGNPKATRIVLPNRNVRALIDQNQHLRGAYDTHICLIGRLDSLEQLHYTTILLHIVDEKNENNKTNH